MPKPRYFPQKMPYKRVIPFSDAQEAWFWFIRSTRARMDGARLSAIASNETRPCEPDDVYRIVLGLREKRLLRDDHLRVLAQYGWRESPPAPRLFEEEHALCLWDEALDRLTTPLIAKGIVFYDG